LTLNREELEDVHRRFGNSVQILDQLPNQQDLIKSGSWLEKISGTVGLEKWMLKSKLGVIIAIVVVPPGINSLVDFWSPRIQVGFEYARPYVEIIEKTSITMGQNIVAFLPEPKPGEREQSTTFSILAPSMGKLTPIGAGLSEIDVIVYRLTRPEFPALGASGASRRGGRWNDGGSPVLYTSDSVLAALAEVRRYFPAGFTMPELMLHEIRVVAMAEFVSDAAKGFASSDSWMESQSSGSDWIRRGQSDVLVAPSPVDPTAQTLVVNLMRKDRIQLEIVRSNLLKVS
jgi:RES domain-containing protein